MGLSVDLRSGAARLRQFIGEELAQAPDEATHDAHVAQAREQLSALRSRATSDGDRKVVLLLALLMAKDNERKRLVFQTRQGLDYGSAQAEIASLYEARETCDAEILGWLEHVSVEPGTLQGGRCLAEAQQAAAVLGQ